MMKYFLLIVLPCLLFSCTNVSEKTIDKPALTVEQESAFDALNMLQVSTDKKNQIYSTFANIEQPCYPADTSFTITQSEFLLVMKEFVWRKCKNLPTDQQDFLAETSVKAQEEYNVLYCSDRAGREDYESGLAESGKWVIPNIQERIDLVIVW